MRGRLSLGLGRRVRPRWRVLALLRESGEPRAASRDVCARRHEGAGNDGHAMTKRQIGARLRKVSARGLTIHYLHTLDGKPAYFDGEQLVFAWQLPHWEDEYDACRCCSSVAQIESQQEAHEHYRNSYGWDLLPMGYVVIGVSAK
jgi:hypothetical protein